MGIRVDPLNVSELNSLALEAVANDEKTVIANHNLHSLYVFHHDEKMRLFHDRVVDHVHIDGMGVLLLGRLLGHQLQREHRVTYVDWVGPLLKEADARHWRVFYLGMRASTCERIPEVLNRAMPNLELETAHWDVEHISETQLNRRVLEMINSFRPQILLVGLGMPRQERWILDNYNRVSTNVILPCGAAMDYVTGIVPTPPRWAGRYGLEWFFRLLSQPRHLWRRYLLEPWYILRLLCSEIVAPHSGAKPDSNS